MSRLRYGLLLVSALMLASAASADPDKAAMPQHPCMMMNDGGHAAMLETLETEQAKLDDLAAAMQAAEGTAKIDAMADVIEELVAQRRAMTEHMQAMHACKAHRMRDDAESD